MKTQNKSDYIFKTKLLERGWSKKAIESLLPDPIMKPNPQFRKSPPMLLWELETVLQMEESDEFKKFKNKKYQRSLISKKVAERKTQILLDKVDMCIINVRYIPEDKLTQRTIDYKIEWYMQHDDYCDISGVDETTLQRWKVNYIRHNLTQYEYYCHELSNRVGKQKAYELLREKTLNEIARVYPYLSEECERQKINL